MFMSWLWVNDDIGSTFKDILSDLIIPIIVLWFLGNDSDLGEGEDSRSIFDKVISGVIIIGPWRHL